jgi:predicted esterase
MRRKRFFPLTAGLAAAATVALVVPLGEAQSPAHRRLVEDRVLLEQLPGTISRALAALDPGPEVEARIQQLFQEAVGHYTSGRTGECRRILYEALAVVTGREWTERDDYWRSLLLSADTVITDPARPLIVRLTQIYPSRYAPAAPLKMRAKVVAAGSGSTVRDLGVFEGIGIEFIDTSFAFAVDLAGLDDRQYYDIVAEVFEGSEPLRKLATPVYALSGLDEALAETERRLAPIDGHDSAKATVRYPFDRALQVNLGTLEPERYDFGAAVDASMKLLAELEAGRNPLYGATGDHERHYWFEEAREIMPYRILVPGDYDGSRPYPLIVALHGMGGTHDTLFEMDGGILPKATEAGGYILASPMGYRRGGGYGSNRVEGAQASPTRRRLTHLSYLDVMNVLELVRDEYEIDDNRIYLMGGSMGGGGTWRIASRHPEIWAAIAPICAGIMLPEVDLEGMRHLPVVITHGDADTTVPVERSRAMAAAMKKLGMTYEYHEFPGAGHLILKESLQPTMDFFATHTRKP